MPTELQNDLSIFTKERWESLPNELKEIIVSDIFDSQLERIASYYTLNEHDSALLANEILLVLFLFEPLSKLKDSLTKETSSISPDTADAIISELLLTVFYGVTILLSSLETVPEFSSIRQSLVPQPLTTTNKDLREDLELRPDVVQKETTLEKEIDVNGKSLPKAPKDLREELELRPETASKVTSSEENVRPLTRDEVLKSLSPSRTMASDIASAQQNNGK